MALDRDLDQTAPLAETRIPEGRRIRGLTYGRHVSSAAAGWSGYYVQPVHGHWLIARLTPADNELVGTDEEILAALRAEAEDAAGRAAAKVLGRKGGLAGRGQGQRRGDSAHYRAIRARRPAPQTYEAKSEWGGYTVREGLKGWIVEQWSRVQGQRTGRRTLVPYSPEWPRTLVLGAPRNDSPGAATEAEAISILGGPVRVLRAGHIVQ